MHYKAKKKEEERLKGLTNKNVTTVNSLINGFKKLYKKILNIFKG